MDNEKFSIDKYSEFIFKHNFLFANNYKDKFIPKKLFRYVPLFDETRVNYEDENDKRINALEENKIWVSNYKELNDPFEFKSLFLDHKSLKEYNYPEEDVEKIIEIIRNSVQICCFSGTFEKNMPLWAHYANNHMGFCIEYSVLKSDYYLPITYARQRQSFFYIATEIFNKLLSAFEIGEELDEEFFKFYFLLYSTWSVKQKLWSYEEEFRHFHFSRNTKGGKAIPLSTAKLKIDKIYLGYKCLKRDRLINVGDKIGCEVYEMIYDDTNINFTLSYTKIKSG